MKAQLFLLLFIIFLFQSSANANEAFYKAHSILVFQENEIWSHFNWESFDQDKIVSYKNYQYSIYWDKDKILTILRRNLENNEAKILKLESYLLPPKDSKNPHRSTVLGISPQDGRLHLAWGHHADDFKYTKTRANFITEPPENLDLNDFEPMQLLSPDMAQRVTYPRFFNDRNDNLYFIYRSGVSGNAKTILSKYEADIGEWNISEGFLFDYEGIYPDWNNSTTRNAYLHDVLFDTNNRLHITWIYRELSKSWASNHDLHYAYSDDSGTRWKNNFEQQIADLSKNDAISLTDPDIIVQQIPVYSWLMNQCAMALDSDNQPHVALFKLSDTFIPEKLEHDPPVEVKKRLSFFHYWRDKNGNWHSSKPLAMFDTSNTLIDSTQGKEQTNYSLLKRPNLVFDKNNNVLIYWSSNDGFRAYASSSKTKWKDWKLLKLTDDSFMVNDASKHDRRLLKEKNILSFSAALVKNDMTQSYAILDFDLNMLSNILESQRAK